MPTPTGSKLIGKPGGLVEPGIQKYGFWEWAGDNWKDLIKYGGGAAKYYVDYQDQKKRNEMEEAAYRKYMEDAEHAGEEARAAIDLNLTPMEISNIPQTKADVSDFTAVAARGGLMNLPTRQRKRYATQGFVEDDIEVMDIDVGEPTTVDLEKETGLNLSGEQVFHDTGDDRTNAQNVWQSGSIDQEIYQLDFEIFFQSGDWQDHISRGTVQGDTQMASHEGNDAFLENRYQELLELNLSPAEAAAQAEQELSSGNVPGPMAGGGIAGLRHGGRPGYQFGIGPQQGMMPQGMMPQGMMPQQGRMPPQGLMPNQMMAANGGRIGFNKGTKKMSMYQEYLEDVKEGFEGTYDDYVEMYYGKAQGGRIKKAPGGIMNLGGLEKDYRTTGGFVPIGAYEKKDDVPARLSKNEFVMTADAVRAAGGGSINKGAQRMYDTMKHLEASPQSNRMIA